MTQLWKYDQVYDAGLQLGEGPVWISRKRSFYCVDIERHVLVKFQPDQLTYQEFKVPDYPSAVSPCADGRLLIAYKGGVGIWNPDTGDIEEAAKIETDLTENRCNDGKCDMLGRFWIGTMHFDGRKGNGALYCVSGNVRKIIPGVGVSNGIGWSPDHRMMYHVDSAEGTLSAYDYDPDNAVLSGKQVLMALHGKITPDGLAVDREGMLWVALWNGFGVCRFDPYLKKVIGMITVPAPLTTSCAFGGDDGTELLITTARTGLTAEELKKYPLSGGLFLTRTGINGIPAFDYRWK